jgi:hypothetical protein
MQSCSSPGPLAPTAMPQSAGRPRALTNSKRSEIIKLITEGLALENAAKHVGCSVRTIRREMKRDPSLADVVRSSQNVALLNSLRTVLHACQDDWRAAKWLLERQFPELFAGRGQNSALGKRQIRQLLHEVLQIVNDEAIDANQRERLNGRIRVAFEYLTHVYCAPNRSTAGLRRATELFQQKDKQNDSFADLQFFTNLSTNDHCSHELTDTAKPSLRMFRRPQSRIISEAVQALSDELKAATSDASPQVSGPESTTKQEFCQQSPR